MLSEPILQNIPRNGGVRNVASPWTNIGCQEIFQESGQELQKSLL